MHRNNSQQKLTPYRSQKKLYYNFVYIYIYIYIFHDVSKCMSCHKVIVVITGRSHCFQISDKSDTKMNIIKKEYY